MGCLIIDAVDGPAILTDMAAQEHAIGDLHIPFHPRPNLFVPPISREWIRTGLRYRRALSCRCTDMDWFASLKQDHRRGAFAKPSKRDSPAIVPDRLIAYFPPEWLHSKCVRPMRLFQNRPADPIGPK